MGYCSVKQLKEVLSHLPDDLGLETSTHSGDIQILGTVNQSDEFCGWIVLGDISWNSADAELQLFDEYKHLKL
jgi:hypothetical protein